MLKERMLKRLASKKQMLKERMQHSASKKRMLAYLLAGILRYAASKERMLGKMQAGIQSTDANDILIYDV